ncbi:hypothetical protein GEMRC1_013176 [Eukaryota sp. GEM-RC1]
MEPYSTSVNKILTCLFATTTKICTGGCSSPPHDEPSTQPPHLPYTLRHQIPQWTCIGGILKRHPFSGLIHLAGKLLHTSERIPTSMATVLLSKCINTFCGF